MVLLVVLGITQQMIKGVLEIQGAFCSLAYFQLLILLIFSCSFCLFSVAYFAYFQLLILLIFSCSFSLFSVAHFAYFQLLILLIFSCSFCLFSVAHFA